MKAGAITVTTWLLPLVLLGLGCLVIAADPGGLASHVRGIEYDAYQLAKPRPYEDTTARAGHAVKILAVDADSEARLGPWPWPHRVLARLVREAKAAGASVVVLDVPLDTPDPAARLAQLLPDTPATAGLRAQLAQLPSPDDALAQALGTVPAVTAFAAGDDGLMPPVKAAVTVEGDAGPFPTIPGFAAAAGPLQTIAHASAGLGARNLAIGRDGVVRAMPVLVRLDGQLVPSLDAEALRVAQHAADIEVEAGETGLPGLYARTTVTAANIGPYDIPLRADGAMEIYYSLPAPERLVSAAALDEGKLPAGTLKNAIVYVSPPDATMAAPGGLRTRGEIHAQALENMVLGTALKPASTAEAALAFVIVVGAGIVFLFARGAVVWAGLLTAAAIAAAQGLGWFLFDHPHMLLDAANPSVALAAAFLAGFAARRFDIARARTRLRTSFADSLPPRTISILARRPALLNLGGETRTISSLACGIRGFAGIAETFTDDPAGFTRLVNTAVAPLIEDAVESGGMIARFDGESFTTCWNTPVDDPEHAIHACEAATRMTVTLAEVNEQLSRERRLDGTPYAPIEIGIGISTGIAIGGAFTANGRTLYSVTGDATVMAERIRGLSAQYGPAVIVSEDARKAAQRGFAFLEVDYIAAGTRDKPVKLYAMLGNPLVRASPKFRALETFHEHIFQAVRQQQWEKARGLIDQCRKLSGASQKIYDLHLTRIAYFEENPPGKDWDGAFRSILK